MKNAILNKLFPPTREGWPRPAPIELFATRKPAKDKILYHNPREMAKQRRRAGGVRLG